jgi:lysophospholipase L1-like esterase
MMHYRFFQLRLLPQLPFLVSEAKHLHRHDPKLPARSSRAILGEGDKHVLLLGESTVAGLGTSSLLTTLAGNFHRLLGPDFSVETVGKTGMRAKGMLDWYLQNRHAPPPKTTGIFIFLGANDCFKLTSPTEFRRQLEQLLNKLQSTTCPDWIYLADIPPVHLFPAFSEKMCFFLERQRAYLRMEMEQLAEQRSNLIFHPLNLPLQPDFFSEDLVHPSDKGYQKIAEVAFAELSQRAVLS